MSEDTIILFICSWRTTKKTATGVQ